MTDQTQPASRWAAFSERWKAGAERDESPFTRFKAAYDAFAGARPYPVHPWLIVLVALGVIALGTALTFGAIWMADHRRWVLIIPLLKVGKFALLGLAIVGAFVYRTWFKAERNGAEGTGAAPK